MTTASYLQGVLDSYKVNEDTSDIQIHKQKRDQISMGLQSYFGGKIYAPINSGSLAKHTEVSCKFDLDIVVPFKGIGTVTLEAIYYNVSEYFKRIYQDQDSSLHTVRDQTVSIGLDFLIDGKVVGIDVVPGREVHNYAYDKDLNLYVNNTTGTFGKGTRIKTNIQAQIDHIRNNTEARSCIRLLKIWKCLQKVEVKSFLIELITIRAFQDWNISQERGLDTQLIRVLEFIAQNIEGGIALKDPGNSGNNVLDTLSETQRWSIKQQCSLMAQNISGGEAALRPYLYPNAAYQNGSQNYRNNDFG